MNPTTEQKIRECVAELDRMAILKRIEFNSVPFEKEYTEILTSYFGQPEQPDKSLDEIVEKWSNRIIGHAVIAMDEGEPFTDEQCQVLIRQACIEYAATKEKNAQKLCNNLAGVLNAADGDDLIAIVETIIKQRDDAMANQDPHYYFKVHEVGRPLPIDTEILLDDGRWVEACSWPQYDSTINYQARVKKGAK